MTDEKYEELMSMPASDMVEYVMTLESRVRDAEDLLRANEYEICKKCGYWFDTEYPDECVGCEE